MAGAGVALGSTTLVAQAARPRAVVIRTLLRDIEPASLAGRILFHEHLSMRYPLGADQHFTDDVPMMIDEARAAAGQGIGCIVDGGHADMVRSLTALRRIATESGLPVVASGGYYMQRTYPPDLAAKSADQLADELAREATTERFGAFGEIGQQGGVMTADERKVFEAVAKGAGEDGAAHLHPQRLPGHAARRGRDSARRRAPATRRARGRRRHAGPHRHRPRLLPGRRRRRKSRSPSRSVAPTSASTA